MQAAAGRPAAAARPSGRGAHPGTRAGAGARDAGVLELPETSSRTFGAALVSAPPPSAAAVFDARRLARAASKAMQPFAARVIRRGQRHTSEAFRSAAATSYECLRAIATCNFPALAPLSIQTLTQLTPGERWPGQKSGRQSSRIVSDLIGERRLLPARSRESGSGVFKSTSAAIVATSLLAPRPESFPLLPLPNSSASPLVRPSPIPRASGREPSRRSIIAKNDLKALAESSSRQEIRG